MRLSSALLVSALLHAGLLLWAGRGPADPHAAGTAAAPEALLSARLLPAEPAPPPAAATPVTAAQPPIPAAPPRSPQAEAASAAPANRPPRPLSAPRLDIPEAMLPTVQGLLVMKLWVNEQGRVVAFEAEPTGLPLEYVNAVGEALMEVRFAPATQDGRPVAGTYRVEINAEPADPPAPAPDANRQ